MWEGIGEPAALDGRCAVRRGASAKHTELGTLRAGPPTNGAPPARAAPREYSEHGLRRADTSTGGALVTCCTPGNALGRAS